jgi:hypothetical protein
MEDWLLAIGIVVLAIVIAIILSKRSWAHKKKKRPKIDKPSDVESTDPGATFFAILLGLVVTYFIVRFAIWLFSKVPGWMASLAPQPSANTTGWVNYSANNPALNISGTLGIPPNILPFVIVTMVVIIIFALFGGRVFRRNGVLFFIMGVPILYLLGVSMITIVIMGIIIIPIIVLKVFSRSRF